MAAIGNNSCCFSLWLFCVIWVNFSSSFYVVEIIFYRAAGYADCTAPCSASSIVSSKVALTCADSGCCWLKGIGWENDVISVIWCQNLIFFFFCKDLEAATIPLLRWLLAALLEKQPYPWNRCACRSPCSSYFSVPWNWNVDLICMAF